MANATHIQVINDGPRNATVKVTGVLDTSNLAYGIIIDPANFGFAPQSFLVDYLTYAISDQLELQLFWDATTPQSMLPLAGRGRFDNCSFGGLPDDAGAGVTGKIGLSTTGWTSGSQIFSLVFELVKVGGQ